MKFDPMMCPDCGEPAIGTLENVPGVALFKHVAEDGSVEHDGETKLFWDAQESVTVGDEGYFKLTCDAGHDCTAEEIAPKEAHG